MSLPWSERVVSFQVNPESATLSDIVRMAEELCGLHGEAKEPERKKGKSKLVYDKVNRTIKKESGEPTCLSISEDLPAKEPPTDAWEEWIKDMPDLAYDMPNITWDIISTWRRDMKEVVGE